jgi:hypothetical protein
MTLEYIHITVHHGCGHTMLRAVRRDDETTLANVRNGEMDDWRNCKHCIARALRDVERKMEKAGKL